MHATSDSKVKIMSFKKPENLLFNGIKTPVSEVERALGKSLCMSFGIDSTEYDAFKKYCQEKLVCHYPMGNQLKTVMPVPYSYLDIFNMGDFGYGVRAVKPIPKNALVCYYFGEIFPNSSKVLESRSLYRLNLCNDESKLTAKEKYVIDVPGMFCHASLMQHLPNQELLDGLYEFKSSEEKAKVAIANIDWDTVHLFDAGPGYTCAVVALYACRNIEAGEICGYNYNSSYWYNKEQEPALFDRSGNVIDPASYHSKLITVPPESHTYNNSGEEDSSLAVISIQKTMLAQGEGMKGSLGWLGASLSPIDLAIDYIKFMASQGHSLPVPAFAIAQGPLTLRALGGAGGSASASSGPKP
ncbi:MAG: hypothetical protein K0R66_1150 [Gammaproteobacteria bacterium]|jgi:hypothetical protein|nr:hypothetical protein [Gammaproteobacteria bacterium]